MKLTTASNVCKKINHNAAYAFLLEPSSVNWDEKADAFIQRFANEHELEATSVAPGMWSFSHEEHGHLDDGVIELEMNNTKPVFKLIDVSESKITSNSPDIDSDLKNVNNRIQDAKVEYIDRLKTAIKTSKEAIDDLSLSVNDKYNEIQSELDIDDELVDLQKKYHMAMDRLIEIKCSTEENYESLKARVEMSMISLKYSIENTVSKIDKKS
jgi:DNA repair ATPase RecN